MWNVGRFFGTPEGQALAKLLFVLAVAVTIMTKGAGAALLVVAMTGFGLGLGGTIAGFRARDGGECFWEGFSDYIRNDWAQSVAISSAIVLTVVGVGLLAKAGIALAGAAKTGGKKAGVVNAVSGKPANVGELVTMMNKRKGLSAKFATGDELVYLKKVQAEGSHMLMITDSGKKSFILLDKSKATRTTAFHEYMHYVMQSKKGMSLNGQDALIEGFLSRHSNFLRL